MRGYSTNIETVTNNNRNFRRVLHTAPHIQLVVMTLKPGEDIGVERHPQGDQFLRVESGSGEAIIDGQKHALSDGAVVIVPAGAEHNVVNTSKEPLRLYTVYSWPAHKDGAVHRTKREAEHEEHPST